MATTHPKVGSSRQRKTDRTELVVSTERLVEVIGEVETARAELDAAGANYERAVMGLWTCLENVGLSKGSKELMQG